MRNQIVNKNIAALGVVFLLLLIGLEHNAHAQSDNSEKTEQRSLALLNEIKSIIKEKEKSWSFEKEHVKNNHFNILWTLKKKRATVDITEHETIEIAIEGFADMGDGSRLAVNVPVKLEKNFADESMLRITNLNGGSTVNYCFRQGKYTISIWANEKIARRFASHVLEIINAQ